MSNRTVTPSVTLPSQAAIARNAQAGFRKPWPVFERYEFSWVVVLKTGEAEGAYTDAGINFLDEKRARARQKTGARVEKILRPVIDPVVDLKKRDVLKRLYVPAVEAGLLEELQTVTDEASFKVFVERFGLLGYQQIARNWGGDHVAWAIEQARTVTAAFEIATLLRGASREKIAKQLPTILARSGMALGAPKDKRAAVSRWMATAAWPRDPAGAAWNCLQTLLNPALGRIHFELPDVSSPQSPELALKFNALIDLIGWRVATEAQNLNPFVCKRCGRLAFAERAGGRKETCSSACRMAYSRAQQRKSL